MVEDIKAPEALLSIIFDLNSGQIEKRTVTIQLNCIYILAQAGETLVDMFSSKMPKEVVTSFSKVVLEEIKRR